MNKVPLVSVVVPTYNRPDFLCKTLQSIVNQTYKNLQVIVVSNGFNSDNQVVVSNIKDPRIEYYEQENTGGPASPRNYGIREAKGAYIAFCDDDDLWLPEKIHKQVTALKNNSSYGLCYTKMLRFNNNREWAVSHEAGVADFQSLLFRSTVPISSILIATSLVRRYGGFCESPKVGTSEDYEFILRYALKTRFYYIDEFLIKYWSGDNRTTCLDFRRSIKTVFIHIKTILYIYLIIYKNSNTSFLRYLKPTIFNIKNSLRVILHIIMQRMRLR